MATWQTVFTGPGKGLFGIKQQCVYVTGDNIREALESALQVSGFAMEDIKGVQITIEPAQH